MRNVPRRSFTVEAKSGGRRLSTIIPSRVAAPPVPPRVSLFPTTPAPAKPAAEERRRILPSLIVPDVPQPEPVAVAEEPPVRRPRGRPRKPKDQPGEAAPALVRALVPTLVEEAAPVSPVEPPEAEVSARPPRQRKAVPAHDLPRGERWKTRRLGRWSR